jgi:benzoyl-CoA-dihydrodiol lyase
MSTACACRRASTTTRRGSRPARARGWFGPTDALAAGLVTFAPDDIDWADEVRLAIEERTASPTPHRHGSELPLRRPRDARDQDLGRLTAWQNWIFIRPNSTGAKGALTLYGKAGQRPEFDWRRT